MNSWLKHMHLGKSSGCQIL